MNENFIIARATLLDTAQLVQLINSAYRGETSKQGWTTEADLLDGIRTDEQSLTHLIQEPDSSVLKLTNEKKEIIGCVYLKKQEAQMYLGMLTVAPALQGSGIGYTLLQHAEDFALKQGCSSIIMTVISVRAELIAWYERHGYKMTGERQPFPSDPRFGMPKQPLEFVVMKKEI